MEVWPWLFGWGLQHGHQLAKLESARPSFQLTVHLGPLSDHVAVPAGLPEVALCTAQQHRVLARCAVEAAAADHCRCQGATAKGARSPAQGHHAGIYEGVLLQHLDE